tara:strand:+ start:663 stop:923 length:261 start_codon:yes stop_codon:yes gene_type:complete
MKKILLIIVLSLLWCGTTYSKELKPKYAAYSLNKNIIEHGWLIKSKRTTSEKDIYTLSKFVESVQWLLVCQINYKNSSIETDCTLA